MKKLLIILLSTSAFLSCKKPEDKKDPETPTSVTDIDGNVYQTVTIGNQVWLASNLKTTHFRNGDPIPYVSGTPEWSALNNTGSAGYCYQSNDLATNTTYGKIYNYYAVIDTRGICPAGWHIPSESEWNTLINYLGGTNAAGGKMKMNTTWNSPNTGATNSSGFNAVAAGDRSNLGVFNNFGLRAGWWASNNVSGTQAACFYIDYDNTYCNYYPSLKGTGFTLRCIKD